MEFSGVPHTCGILGFQKTYLTFQELKQKCDAQLKKNKVQKEPRVFYRSRKDYLDHWKFASDIAKKRRSVVHPYVSCQSVPSGEYQETCKDVQLESSPDYHSCYLSASCRKRDGTWNATFVNYAEKDDSFMNIDGILTPESASVDFTAFDHSFGARPYVTDGIATQVLGTVQTAQDCFELARDSDALAWAYISKNHPTSMNPRSCQLFSDGVAEQGNNLPCDRFFCPDNSKDLDEHIVLGCVHPTGSIREGCRTHSPVSF
jgi:hypothetical protein